MSTTDEAVTDLEELGLTEYEARCFVALTQLSKGTAKEVSKVAEIPRSRVYDTIERLDKRGFVMAQESEPREYKAVPIEMAMRRIKEDYDSRVNAAENSLHQVEEPESKDDEGMWAITQPDHVTDRICTFLDEAEEQIRLLIATEDVIDQRILTSLHQATDRGVRVIIEVANEDIHDRLHKAVPDAEVIVTADLADTNSVYAEWPGQLLMVDKQSIVAGGIEESDLPDVTQEVAVWTYGHDHGFAAWMRELLDNRLATLDIEA
ncbi:TrmB family transcriptional regulator (plasmid) [Natrinema zhouii]|uniref:TrmB family transcriptional regulator n=1 Tax=Natrinema zhouii TaxID=1710539 RepID=UPI001CFF876B|nr:helix-turn-helix domain-containing protein [Natrinema zhouii]UHQ98925.1 TrmB family transcriptional regulator [Natrinema zhouii]